MEYEADPKIKNLSFKIKSVSKETAGSKATNLCENDMRSNWSTNTNAKEWVLLELDESCLLTSIKVQNKSVLEWEISASLKNKQESFVKVKARCEAPRRETSYVVNYMPCKYIKIFCFRGSPISIFYVQVTGIPLPGLVPEFQHLVEYMTPNITNSRDTTAAENALQTVRDITNKLNPFIPNLKSELDASVEDSLKFFSLLVGPFQPILNLASNKAKEEAPVDAQMPVVSSNFKALNPKKSKNDPDPFVFQPTPIINLLRSAYTNATVRSVTMKVASAISEIEKLQPKEQQANQPAFETNTVLEEAKPKLAIESLLYLLFGCGANEEMAKTLSSTELDFMSIYPLLRILAPALRSAGKSLERSEGQQFKTTSAVDRAFTLIITLTTNPSYSPLVKELNSYLLSGSTLQETAACILLDLSVGPLASWIPQMTAKVDLLMEILTDCLHIIQGGKKDKLRANAVILFIKLALAGYFDSKLSQFLEAKHQLLFLIQLLSRHLNALLSGTRTSENELAFTYLQRGLEKRSVLATIEGQIKDEVITPSSGLAILAPDLPRLRDVDKLYAAQHKALQQKAVAEEGSAKYFMPQIQITEEEAIPSAEESTNEKQDRELVQQLSRISAKLSPNSIEDYFSLDAEFLQLTSFSNRYVKAKQFSQFAEATYTAKQSGESTQTKESIDQQVEVSINSLLLAAECHLNPYFMASVSSTGKQEDKSDIDSDATPEFLEERRDAEVLKILVKAAYWDSEYRGVQVKASNALDISENSSVDLITLVRLHQDVLYSFLSNRLNNPKSLLHEVLLQGLIYIVKGITFWPDTSDLLKVVLNCIAKFNQMLQQRNLKERSSATNFDVENIRRYWALIHKLLETCIPVDENSLIPYQEWLNILDSIKASPFPLIRYFGYKAVSRSLSYIPVSSFPNYKVWTSLLGIYYDELMVVSSIGSNVDQQTVAAYYPELADWFPTLNTDFAGFASTILSSVLAYIRKAPAFEVPGILTWFTDLCTPKQTKNDKAPLGFQRSNFNHVALAVLEETLKYQLDVVIPEFPRFLNIVLVLCINPLTNVDVLERIFRIIQPVFKREDRKFANSFENLLFDRLMASIQIDNPSDLLLFLIAKVLPEFSQEKKKLVLQELPRWINKTWKTKGVSDRLRGFAWIFNECKSIESEQLANLTPSLWNALDGSWTQSPQLTSDLIEASLRNILSSFNAENADKILTKLLQSILDLQANQSCWSSTSIALSLFSRLIKEEHLSKAVVTALLDCLQLRVKKAPRLEWRTDVLNIYEELLQKNGIPLEGALIEFFSSLLKHAEQEIRNGALSVVERLLNTEEDTLTNETEIPKSDVTSRIYIVATRFWKYLLDSASNDPFPFVKKKAVILLERVIPFLPSTESGTLMEGIQTLTTQMLSQRGQPRCLGLQLLAITLLHHAETAKSLGSQLWKHIEDISNDATAPMNEHSLAQSLLKARTDAASAKDELSAVLSGQPSNTEVDTSLAEVRNSILRTLLRVQEADKQRLREQDKRHREIERLEELEIEAELLREERILRLENPAVDQHAVQQLGKDIKLPTVASNDFSDIRNHISALEKQIQEEQRLIKLDEIKSRKRLDALLRHERAMSYHRAKLQEQKLLLQLDQERDERALREIERQRALEIEKEKTREVKFQMELEAEKKAQKDTEKEPHRKPREYSARANRYRNREGEKDSKEQSAETPTETVDVRPEQLAESATEQEHGEYNESAETDSWGYDMRDRGKLKPRDRRTGERPERRERDTGGRNQGKWERKQ